MERLGLKFAVMERYNRNILIEGFGEGGQEKLSKSKVLVIGAGGLGSPVLYYLAAAGVGTLGIMDYDIVDITNLQRQILHSTSDIGCLKVESAKRKIEAFNPNCKVCVYPEKFTQGNSDIVDEYDFVVDCCDNYDTKFLISDICVEKGKPFSHGAVVAMRGEVMTYVPGSASYRDIFSMPPEEKDYLSASRIGILGSVAGVIGSIQATETIKFLVGIEDLLVNRLLVFDGISMKFSSLKIN